MHDRTLPEPGPEPEPPRAPVVAAPMLGGAGNAAVARTAGAYAPAGGAPRPGATAVPGDNLIARALIDAAQRRQGARTVARAEAAAPPPATAAGGPGSGASAQTAGGMWRTKKYEWRSDGSKFSAHIELEFWPELPVETGRIGLVQTVKTLRSTTADKSVSTPTFVRGGTNEQLALPAGSGDRGRAIDQPSRITTDTSPLYATQGDGAKTLAGAVEAAGIGTFGHPRGPTSPAAPATMSDDPDFVREFDSQEWVQTFEVTALVLDGPLANEYLGSIEWGWRCEGGKVRMDPNPIRVLRQGAPTAQFMEAAKRWNDAQVRGEDTVDLPLVPSDAGALSTVDLGKRVVEARQAGTSDARAEFELHALEQELMRRNVRVVVTSKKTGDWLGPDNLYVRLAGKRPNGKETKDIRANEGPVEFLVPIQALAATTPLTDPIKVELFDEDTLSGDDLLVSLDWTPPGKATASRTSSDGNYTVEVSYER